MVGAIFIATPETTRVRRVRAAAWRIVMGRIAYSFVVLAMSLGIAPAASAQETVAPPPSAAPESPGQPASTAAAQPALVTPFQPKRPAAMLPLYAGFAVTQVLDYVSTTHAVANGAGREGNPVMAPVSNRAALVALKAGSVAGVVWAGEKLWRRNRVGAIVFMVAMDSAIATIAARNYSIARR